MDAPDAVNIKLNGGPSATKQAFQAQCSHDRQFERPIQECWDFFKDAARLYIHVRHTGLFDYFTKNRIAGRFARDLFTAHRQRNKTQGARIFFDLSGIDSSSGICDKKSASGFCAVGRNFKEDVYADDAAA